MGFRDYIDENEEEKRRKKQKKSKVKSSKKAFKDADTHDEETKLRDTVDDNSSYDNPGTELRFK